MRNRWSVYPDAVVGWTCELPALPDDRLGSWSRAVLAAGARTGVLLPLTPVPAGPLPFADVLRTASRVAFANADGDVVEDDVADMAALVAAVPSTAAALHARPVRVGSLRRGDGRVSTSIGLATDIWLPWTPARKALRAATGDLGGRFHLDGDATSGLFAFEVDDSGVLLDVPLSARA